MVLAKTGPWKFVIVYVINWYILQLRITHNWQEIRLIVLMLLICRLSNYNYLLCDMSRIIYT